MAEYITEPGKFEGQLAWVPKAYESILCGLWDTYKDI